LTTKIFNQNAIYRIKRISPAETLECLNLQFQTEAIFALAGNFAIFTDNFPRFADNSDI